MRRCGFWVCGRFGEGGGFEKRVVILLRLGEEEEENGKGVSMLLLLDSSRKTWRRVSEDIGASSCSRNDVAVSRILCMIPWPRRIEDNTLPHSCEGMYHMGRSINNDTSKINSSSRSQTSREQ